MATKEYRLRSGRGIVWRINSKGEFYVSGRFSPTWRIFGIASRWNGRPASWTSVKARADKGKVIEGYLYDIDHGSKRFWGGRYGSRLPKVILRKA